MSIDRPACPICNHQDSSRMHPSMHDVTVLLNIEQNDRIDALETQVAEMQR